MSEQPLPLAPGYVVIDPVASEDLPQDTPTLVQHYVELMRRQPRVRVDPIQVPSVRRPLLFVGAACAVALYAATVRFLLQSSVNPSARPPAAVLAIEAADLCMQHQTTIMRAVAAYTRDHGEAPRAIAQLLPQYLTAAPADPLSGRPYEYVRQGAAVVVACPNRDLCDAR